MARHLIYRQKIMLNLSGKQEAFALQEKVSRMIKYELSDSLENALDRAFPPDKIVRIDTLHLNLGTISLQNFENEFKAGFIDALTKNLSEKSEAFRHTPQSADKKEELLGKSQSLKETLFFFLQKGYLPWYSHDWKISEWETEILNNFTEEEYRSLIKWLRDKFPENPVVIDRLVFQFSDKFIETLMLKIRSGFNGKWPLIFADYHFILTNLLKPPAKIKKQERDIWQNPDFKHVVDDFQAIREKIWQFALRVWFDAGSDQPITKTLQLLLTYFGISSRYSNLIRQNNLLEGIKTVMVKEAFETVLLKYDMANGQNDQTPTPKKSTKNKPDDSPDTGEMEDLAENETAFASNKTTKAGKKRKPDSTTDDPSSLESDKKIKPAEDEQDAQAGAQAFLNKTAKKDIRATPKKDQPEPGDIITVNNCGIVILHPFLMRYFEDMGLVSEGAFISEAARGRAVLLLHYLATGETTAAEFDLALQKILCGYPADETLSTSIKLTKKEKSGSETLLKAVIDHWAPLKNTSVEGLRGTFLRRPGNLELRENGWVLKIEQKTWDILLGKLPWGFSTIRLRWMKELLSVDWC